MSMLQVPWILYYLQFYLTHRDDEYWPLTVKHGHNDIITFCSKGYHLPECQCVALGQVPFMKIGNLVHFANLVLILQHPTPFGEVHT